MGFFDKTKGTTIEQEEMLTAEQKEVMSLLTSFSKTGKFGDFQAGESYKDSLGNFEMTDIEKTGQNKLMELISGNMPEMFDLGKDEIKKLLTTDKYDPYAKGGQYAGFKTGVQRNVQESTDALKRDLAVTGDLYSSNTGKQAGLLQERGNQQLTNKLAELYDTFTGRKLAGAETAANMGLQEEGVKTGRIGLSQSLGSLGRILKDAEAKTKYSDWLRGRSEWGQSIDAAKSVMNKDVQYGLKSITTPDSPSPFSNLLNKGLELAGGIVGSYLGGKAMGAGFKSSSATAVKSAATT